MSLPEIKERMFGKLSISFFAFAAIGDELPIHNHDETDNHITIIRKGKFKVFGDGWSQEHEAGAVLDWKVGQRHGFIAMTDEAALINIVKG